MMDLHVHALLRKLDNARGNDHVQSVSPGLNSPPLNVAIEQADEFYHVDQKEAAEVVPLTVEKTSYHQASEVFDEMLESIVQPIHSKVLQTVHETCYEFNERREAAVGFCEKLDDLRGRAGMYIDGGRYLNIELISSNYCSWGSIHATLAIMAHDGMLKQPYKEENIDDGTNKDQLNELIKQPEKPLPPPEPPPPYSVDYTRCTLKIDVNTDQLSKYNWGKYKDVQLRVYDYFNSRLELQTPIEISKDEHRELCMRLLMGMVREGGIRPFRYVVKDPAKYFTMLGNGGMNMSCPGEIAREEDKLANLESGLEKCNSVKDAGAKTSSSSNEKNLISDGDEEMIERFDDVDNIRANEKDNDIVLEQKQVDNKVVTASAKEGGLVSEENVDLLKDLKFQDVPNIARSSSILEGSKDENDPMNEDAIKSEVSEIHVIDVANGKSDVNTEQEPDHGLSAFGSSNSVFNDRGEKRAIDDETDDRESFKKHKEWIPTMDSPSDPCLPLSNSMENRPLSPDQKNLNFSLFSKDRLEGFECMQEKQLFPGSFKSFDLNLNGTCDVNQNHDIDITSPSVSQTRKEVTPINVDLSMSKKSNLPDEIEIIDLDNDSAQEDKTFNNFGRREDAVFTDLESFPNNVHNANGNPGIQDGYGLMLSELLGNNSNCSSVPADLNPLHNDIGLTNGEGILGDDDSIYMSLGEIPISFLSAWEQPTQDYGKPF